MKMPELPGELKKFVLQSSDALDLMTSRFLDIQDIDSVCLALGPYRNLTTLTASMLFLHPKCQVLNHAAERIYGNNKIDFLRDYSRSKLDRFIRFAVTISGKGRRGNSGGSITFSHAFDSRYEMGEIYRKTGMGKVKKEIRCLFWKESLRTSNLIREKQVDLPGIFSRDERLRFLMPIRNPLDCAEKKSSGRCESADENRQRVRNERVRHERYSQPSWPRVMPRPTAMGWGSVDRGTHRQAIELRNHLNSQADPVQRRGKQHRTYRSRQGTNGSAESENPGMCGSSLRGNREARQEPCPEANESRAASMKERTRRIDAETSRESDGGIVCAGQCPDQEG